MDMHTATEESYNNGYAKGFEDGKREAQLGSKMREALSNIVWYNCYYVWLKDLRDRLEEHRPGKFFADLIHPDDWFTDRHIIVMILVGMFGDWGTSMRSGWIEDIDGCIKFIDDICAASWEAEAQK
jgi:hypothetical protein